MWKTRICFLLVILAMAVSAQDFVNPYCESFNSLGVCQKCVNRFYLDSKSKICLPVSPLCKTYQQGFGKCTSCFSGFGLLQGGECMKLNSLFPRCAIFANSGDCKQCQNGYKFSSDMKFCNKIVDELIPNCAKSASGICASCQSNYFLTAQNKCIRMSPLCLQYNSSGECAKCVDGFVIHQGACRLPSQINIPEFDPLCAFSQNQVCKRCSWNSFLNTKGRCQQINQLCRTFNFTDGKCLTCYPGYQVSEGQCIIYIALIDPNCHSFTGTKCVKCSQGAYFDQNGTCQLLDPYCKTVTPKGQCTKCYLGYLIEATGKCVKNLHFNCYEWVDGACKTCSRGFYPQKDGSCNMINPLCRNFDHVNKVCIKCYNGYVLDQGQCYEYSKYTGNVAYDPNCRQFGLNGVCASCYNKYFVNYDGICKQVSPYCKNYDKIKGYCLSCYPGYRLNEYAECTTAF